MDMATEDFVLLVMTFMSVVAFLTAVLYERVKHKFIDGEDVHIAAVVAPFALVLASIKLDKPVFMVIGLGIFAVVATYYFLTQRD